MDDEFVASTHLSQPNVEKNPGPPRKWLWILFGSAPFLPEIVWEKLAEAVFVAIIGGLIFGYWSWFKQG